ncbi:hypothetical protein [Luteitalea sp.]
MASCSWLTPAAAALTAQLLVLGSPVFAQSHGGGGGGHAGGGGEEETLGNNLSTPVVFAEGYGITGLPVATDTGLRPRPGETNPTLPFFDPDTVVVKDGVTYYPQASTSTWQAGWVAGQPSGEDVLVGWGDNLLSRTWNTRSVLRVETVLFQQASTALTSYPMTSLFGSKRAEVFGTTGTAVPSTYRTVFAVTPRLIIERITGPGGSVVRGLPRFEGAVATALETDGPGEYGAEVNGGGSVIYGFNWSIRQWDMPESDKAGWWRITFTLDPVARFSIVSEEGATPQTFTATRNVRLAGVDPADLGTEFTYKPRLVNAWTSVLEIELTSGGATGGGGGGGGGGQGGEPDDEPVNDGDLDDDALPDEWELLYGIDPASKNATADPDGDGLTNEQEYLAGSHPQGIYTRYFAEGVNSSFFGTRLTLVNTSQTAASTVLLRFMTAAGTTISKVLTLPALGHVRLDTATVAGLSATSFSTIVEADAAVAAERTTVWDGTAYGSHASEGAVKPSTTWYMAEGATHSGFSLFYLIGNPDAAQAEVEVRFLRPAPLPPIVKTYSVAPHSRRDVWVNLEDAGLAATDVSAVITSSRPIVVERSMYLDTGGLLFGAGTSATASADASMKWYFAEGAVGDYFDTYLLLLNPGTTDAQVTVTYLLPSGTPLVGQYVVPAGSRSAVWADAEAQLPAGAAFSAIVESTNGVPIVAERAMWWPGPTSATWNEGHVAVGATEAGTKWAIAGPGETAAQGYVLVANTSTFAGVAKVTLALDDGTTLVANVSLPALSRQDIAIDETTFPGLGTKSYGVVVESVGTTPAQIVVELSSYASSGTTHWAAGSSAGAMRIHQ